jgi:uncharacterized protein
MTAPARRSATTTAVVAVAAFHRAGDPERFAAWTDDVLAAVGQEPGFVAGKVSASVHHAFDRAVLVAFESEAALDSWLDGARYRELLTTAAAQGIHRLGREIVLRGSEPPGTGIGVLEHIVEPGLDREFLDTQRRLVDLSATFPGFDGAVVIPTGAVDPDGGTHWWSILRFRTGQQLSSWLQSSERAAALPELRSVLSQDFTDLSRRTPFGSIVRVHDGEARATPEWKSALLVLLVLYPTVMLLTRFVGPVLTGWSVPPWLSMWLSQILSVGLMTYLLMPTVTGWFRRWLDPLDGAGRRITVIGTLAAAVVIAVCLTLFGTIFWLQYWHY